MAPKIKRLWSRIVLKLRKLKGSPHSVAAGLACGVAISFTPFVGLHFVLAALTALATRGNVLASALGTAAGNPWTFPFIWISVFYTGRVFLGEEYAGHVHIDFLHFFEESMRALMTFDFSLFFREIWPILWPMMVGCIPYYIVAWLVTYYLCRGILEDISRRGAKRKEKL